MIQIFSLEMISFAVALVGSSIAAAFDLKTTEIPDKVPYTMIAAALIIYGVKSVIEWNYLPILNSVAVGILLFGFGFVMYYLGQWGGGDAKLLSAIGFLLPGSNVLSSIFPSTILWFPFPVSYLFNVFFVGAVYMLVYAFVLTLINKNIIREFKHDIKASTNTIILSSVALFVALLFLNWSFAKAFQSSNIQSPTVFNIRAYFVNNAPTLLVNSLVPLVLTIGLFLVWKFVRAVENVAFKKRIHVTKLKVGDVLMKSKLWEGLTIKEIRQIKKSGKKYVWIKEGVRFAPAFPLALVFTVYFGDAILLLFRILG